MSHSAALLSKNNLSCALNRYSSRSSISLGQVIRLIKGPERCAQISSTTQERRLLSLHCDAAPSGESSVLDCWPNNSNSIAPEDLLSLLRSKQPETNSGPGEVYLVGTGPGDPGLLTMRAVQLMQTADVVLYDRLVSSDILRLVHGGARMVYVGKEAGFHTRTQAEIHELLLRFAEEGASVLRLKGGDPYIFGRGGEEVQFLEQNGIAVHCVPGITAASGISAELGIPLTHRGVATSVRFLTGHAQDGGEDALDATVAACGDPNTTLVVYMGLGTLPALTARLAAAGLSTSTPAAAVERGTTAKQRVVHARLQDLAAAVGAAGLRSPTLLVIGEVVALSAGWRRFEASGEGIIEGRVGVRGGSGAGRAGGTAAALEGWGRVAKLAEGDLLGLGEGAREGVRNV